MEAMGFPLAPAESPEQELISIHHLGWLSEVNDTFCPLKAVQKYPYKHLSKALKGPVSDAFFAGGKFWKRHWNIYYVYPPQFTDTKPLLLLPAHQVDAFFELINTKLRTRLHFPEPSEEPGFLLHFSDDGTPRPRFLGRCNSKAGFEELEMMMPSEDFQPEPNQASGIQPSERSREAWRRKMEHAINATKNKKQAVRNKKREERYKRQRRWGQQLKRAQRYLGLRSRRDDVDALPLASLSVNADSHQTSADSVQASTGGDPCINGELTGTAAHSAGGETSPQCLDLDRPAPFACESDVVIICVDIESYERNHDLITEIGVATLDTLDLAGVPIGQEAMNWMEKIRVRHFRILENAHLKNKKYLTGCPENFEFGESEWVSIKDAAQALASCFQDPFSRSDLIDTRVTTPTKRNIVLLGHDTQTDINYMRKVGYNPLNNPALLEVLDTAALYQFHTRDVQPRQLGMIMYDLDLIAWHLHNAGNDAAYTLQAMIGICLRDVQGTGTSKAAREQLAAVRLEDALDAAGQQTLDENGGWSSAGDGTDGGDPEPPVLPPSP
ncbi:MAG: hypothetical protein M1838_002420 [Thelocarpon superellum]|nr:MAG: hypothetical protein M1838_002420 [Thelocarpon superellum]